MSDDYTLWADPWGRRWLTRDAMLVAIDERIALSHTVGYRIGRMWERLRRRPVRADARYLYCYRDLVLKADP